MLLPEKVTLKEMATTLLRSVLRRLQNKFVIRPEGLQSKDLELLLVEILQKDQAALLRLIQ
ncbi:MAG: hypothetical protein EBT96_10735 [Betaproteobacteria bacterium]|nr:hypothetical protein [Betaproteobacteria bacterium]